MNTQLHLGRLSLSGSAGHKEVCVQCCAKVPGCYPGGHSPCSPGSHLESGGPCCPAASPGCDWHSLMMQRASVHLLNIPENACSNCPPSFFAGLLSSYCAVLYKFWTWVCYQRHTLTLSLGRLLFILFTKKSLPQLRL